MARVKFNQKQLKQINKNLKKRFNEFASDTTELKKAGEVILREIKVNTREGKSYDGSRLPGIKSSTVAWRKRYAAVNNTSRFYKQSFSNATFMGDTINKLKAKAKKGIITIFGDGDHRKIRGIRVKFLEGSDAPISDIIGGLKKRGWNIIGVSDKARSKIRTQFIRFIRRRLR